MAGVADGQVVKMSRCPNIDICKELKVVALWKSSIQVQVQMELAQCLGYRMIPTGQKDDIDIYDVCLNVS